MYMTEREKAMEFAQQQGYRAYPYGVCPTLYKDAPHLKTAWLAGFELAREERDYF